MATDSNRLLPAVQAVSNLRRMGIEHVMMLSVSPHACSIVAGHMPAVGCVWSKFVFPVFGEEAHMVAAGVPLWHNR